eukprot:m.249183 g.249183  ORF g.249183 m.249183 type:complete len:59 (+) comp40301_c0_seq6:1092-1268(+)
MGKWSLNFLVFWKAAVLIEFFWTYAVFQEAKGQKIMKSLFYTDSLCGFTLTSICFASK